MTTKSAKDIGLPPAPKGHFYRVGPDPRMDGFEGKRWVQVEICKHSTTYWRKKVVTEVVAKSHDAVWSHDKSPTDVISRAGKKAIESFLFLKGEDHPTHEYFGEYV